MLETKLSTCANLLYQWLLPRNSSGSKFTIDLQDFQAWTAEYREKPFSDREVLDALRQLKELQLIKVSKTEVTLEVKPQDILTFPAPLPTEILLSRESKKHNRWILIVEIIAASLLLCFASLAVGLSLFRTNIEVLSTPNPWSILGEDRSVGN